MAASEMISRCKKFIQVYTRVMNANVTAYQAANSNISQGPSDWCLTVWTCTHLYTDLPATTENTVCLHSSFNYFAIFLELLLQADHRQGISLPHLMF